MRFVSLVVKGKFGETSKSLKILWNCLQNFISLFLFWLAAPIVKNLGWYLGSNLGWYLLYLSKKCPKTNLKVLQYQILTLVKRSEKQLPSKANFSLFLLLTCSNFSLELCDRHYSYQNCQKIGFGGVCGELEAKNCFQRQSFTKYLKQILVFRWNSALREEFNFFFSGVLVSIKKISFWRKNWALGYNSMKFLDFPENNLDWNRSAACEGTRIYHVYY